MDKHEVILALEGLLSEVVFGNGYRHYGYWPEGSPDQPTFESINEAQERYFKKVLETIPAGVETILDVGSGTGSIAVRLSARGFRVDCVSPSFTMNAMARRKLPTSATVYDARFEDLDIDAEYNLVLFCESFHYLNSRRALANVRRYALGHVLIFDYFRTRDGDPGDRASYKQFVSLLSGPFASDFGTVRDEDVTPQVLPTFRVLDVLGKAHVKPFLRSFVEQLRRENPFYALLLRWPLARFARKAKAQSRRHDSFAKEREYRLILLERAR